MSSTADAHSAADLDWYSVRCVFRNDGYLPAAYEERITLWRSSSFTEAIGMAEADARDYTEAVGCQYLGLAQAYRLADEVGHGAEVFSLIRHSDLPPADYLTAFFDTGSEHQTTASEPPLAEPGQQRSTATESAETDPATDMPPDPARHR